MRFKVAIVDDEQKSLDVLKSYMEKYALENNVVFDIFEYTDGDQIIDEYVTGTHIIFLDIEMKRLNGMDTAKKIREFDKSVIIIFITNMAQYAIKGYSVEALSFLLKPVPYFAFSQELRKSLDRIEKNQTHHIVINSKSGIKKVNTNDIYYIEVMKHTITIHTTQGNFNAYGTLKDFEKKLSENHFLRCNNCYLVNLAMVKSIEKEFLTVGNDQLKFSRSKKKSFIEGLTAYVGKVI